LLHQVICTSVAACPVRQQYFNYVMKAMIFTSGLQGKLLPGSAETPKALVEVNGEPLLGMLIKRLADSGFTEIILNVHHFVTPITEFIREKNFFGIRIEVSVETDLLLDTGMGLQKVAWFFDDRQPFLMYNLEILSDINLINLFNCHVNSGALATLVVRSRESVRHLLFNDQMELCGWENIETKESFKARPANAKLIPFAFSRIQVINPSIFSLITGKDVFSLVDLYLRLASDYPIIGYRDDDSIWMDLGKKEGMLEAERFFMKN
jgi:NDP-sugar pyrophosphorylase family protein